MDISWHCCSARNSHICDPTYRDTFIWDARAVHNGSRIGIHTSISPWVYGHFLLRIDHSLEMDTSVDFYRYWRRSFPEIWDICEIKCEIHGVLKQLHWRACCSYQKDMVVLRPLHSQFWFINTWTHICDKIGVSSQARTSAVVGIRHSRSDRVWVVRLRCQSQSQRRLSLIRCWCLAGLISVWQWGGNP